MEHNSCLFTNNSLLPYLPNIIAGVELQHVVQHGGWEPSGECNVWVYILALRKYVLISAKALAGYKNPRAQVFPPRLRHILEVMDPPEQVVINNFIDELFRISHPAFKRGGHLRIFVETMVASFLRFLPDMTAKYGRQHVDVCYFYNKAATFGLNVGDLVERVISDYKL